MSAKIEYNGTLLKTVESGTAAKLPVKDKKMAGDIKVKVEKDTPNLQPKDNVTPSEVTQTITADSGYEGLSRVTVGAIPDKYKDVSNLSADATMVLAGKSFYGANGKDEGELLDRYSDGNYEEVIGAGQTFADLDGAYRGRVRVEVDNYVGDKKITHNGTYYAGDRKVITEIEVDVQVEVWDGANITIESL